MLTYKRIFKAALNRILNSENGFALPSILFLVTILSLVILSILTVKYLHQQSILFDIAKVKADYAAVNGVHQIIVEMNSRNTPLFMGEEMVREYNFGLKESSQVTLQQWGLYYKVVSKGKVGRISSERVALIGSRPSSKFDNALYFANTNHQIVLSGTTKIKGDVVTGPGGTTTGTLSGLPTPRTIPVEGSIRKESNPELSLKNWQKVVNNLNDLIEQKYLPQISSESIIRMNANSICQLDSSTVPDNVRMIIADGDAALSGKIARRSEPLIILVKGNIILQKDAYIAGFVFIGSKKAIVIPSSVRIEKAILFSQSSIEVENNASVTAQIFAPFISVHSSGNCVYPSTLVSFQPSDPKSMKQEIRLEDHSFIEGTVALLSENNDDKRSDIDLQSGAKVHGTIVSGTVTSLSEIISDQWRFIDLQSGAKVRGAIVSEREVTLDGSVEGCVITKDFYFYSDPTTYLGWIRSGNINRIALPNSFLVPMGFSENDQLEVLDWL